MQLYLSNKVVYFEEAETYSWNDTLARLFVSNRWICRSHANVCEWVRQSLCWTVVASRNWSAFSSSSHQTGSHYILLKTRPLSLSLITSVTVKQMSTVYKLKFYTFPTAIRHF